MYDTTADILLTELLSSYIFRSYHTVNHWKELTPNIQKHLTMRQDANAEH